MDVQEEMVKSTVILMKDLSHVEEIDKRRLYGLFKEKW